MSAKSTAYEFAHAIWLANLRAMATGQRHRVRVCQTCIPMNNTHFTVTPVDYEPGMEL